VGRAARGATVLAIAAIGVIAALAQASPAPDGTAFVVPTTATAGSHLHVDAKGPDGGLTPKEIPKALGIAFDKGFAFDPAAVAGTCSADQAENYACPADSVIANGSFVGVVQGPGFGPDGEPFNAAVTLYKAPAQHDGDPMGAVFSFKESSSGFKGESLGRLMPAAEPYGMQIRFDKLPLPALPPGLTITINEMKLDIGAGEATPAHSPKVTRKRLPYCSRKRRTHCRKLPYCSRKRKHHCRHRHRSRRSSARAAATGSFLTNPPACSTGWAVQLQLDYDGHQERREAAVPCTSP
jgi:hypothetical protein